MPSVSVAITPLPAHVRTARFIAAAVARRAGVAEVLLDEIRLAVSEACSLAVRVHAARAPGASVELSLEEHGDRFSVRVIDAVPRRAPPAGAAPELAEDLARASGESVILAAPVRPAGPHTPSAPATGSGADGRDATDVGSDADLLARERIGLAVIRGLVDDLRVDYLDTGSVVTMTWPLASPVPGDAAPGIVVDTPGGGSGAASPGRA